MNIAEIIARRGLDPVVVRDNGFQVGDAWQAFYCHGELDQPITSHGADWWQAGGVRLIDNGYQNSSIKTINGPIINGELLDLDDVLYQVAELFPEYLRRQVEPGMYRLVYIPETLFVEITGTFSGDNSYILGDTRIVLHESDVREGQSFATLGLDEDGDIIDTDTTNRFLDMIQDRLDEAVRVP